MNNQTDDGIDLQLWVLRLAMDELGKRWSLNILLELLEGGKRYTELLELTMDGKQISGKALANRINNMVGFKIIGLNELSRQYKLTNRGKKLAKIFYDLGVLGLEMARECPIMIGKLPNNPDDILYERFLSHSNVSVVEI